MKEVRPTFVKPPVVEQAITAMFEPIPGFTIGHFGLFWQRIRSEFPHCASQPAMLNVIEDFGPPQPLSVELIQGAPPQRSLYHSAKTGELVQLQADRFSFNWMLTPGASYPRYDATLPRFWQLFDVFVSFLEAEGLGAPSLTQCELTNVNIIPAEDFGETFADATKALGVHIPTLQRYPTLTLENVQTATQYLMLKEDESRVGRLHVAAQTVHNIATANTAIRLDLTARGGMAPVDRTMAQEFFEYARNAINAAFLEYTSEDAQRHWGKK